MNFQSLRLQTPKTPPVAAFARYPSARRVSRSRGSRLHHWVAGSSVAQAESSSLSYGWIVHLRLLSTQPRGHAVTFSYELESVWLGKDFHLSIHARPHARHPPFRAPCPPMGARELALIFGIRFGGLNAAGYSANSCHSVPGHVNELGLLSSRDASIDAAAIKIRCGLFWLRFSPHPLPGPS